jgi:hypothetical protein
VTDNHEHYASNLLGWRAIRGELRLEAFDRLVMADVTEDVRLRNVFIDLGCESINDFFAKVARQSPRNYGKKSESYLAECLNKMIVNHGLVSGLSEGVSVVGHGIELQVVYGGLDAVTMMRYVKPGLWAEWREHCLGSPLKELKLSQLLNEALLAPPVRVPDLTLSDALNRWSTLDALLCEGNATLLSVIRATTWCANQGRFSDMSAYLAENQNLLLGARSLLDSSPQTQIEHDIHLWNVLWGVVKLRGLMNCGMGEVVAKANANWPSNHLTDPISMYYEASLQKLLARDRMGRVKALAVERCVAYLALHGHRASDAPVAPWDIVKLLNLKPAYLKVLNVRYAGDRVPTLDTCGKQLGLTRERIRQVEAKCGKLAESMQQSKSALAWLKLNIDNIWAKLSADGGVTVDSKDESDFALEKKLGNEYRLALLLANIGIIKLLDSSGNRTENGWSSKTKGAGEIVIRLSGKVKVVDI